VSTGTGWLVAGCDASVAAVLVSPELTWSPPRRWCGSGFRAPRAAPMAPARRRAPEACEERLGRLVVLRRCRPATKPASPTSAVPRRTVALACRMTIVEVTRRPYSVYPDRQCSRSLRPLDQSTSLALSQSLLLSAPSETGPIGDPGGSRFSSSSRATRRRPRASAGRSDCLRQRSPSQLSRDE
jgi:hypothetical protein